MRVVVVALFLVSACGGGSGTSEGGTYSCAEDAVNTAGGDGGGAVTIISCLEVSGGTAQDLANNESSCSAGGGTFSFAPCPRAGAIGGCRETDGSVGSITTWYYQSGPESLSEVQANCMQAASAGLPVQFVTP